MDCCGLNMITAQLLGQNDGGGSPPETPPVNTVAPLISGLTAEGSLLTCTTGTWTGTAPITYSYQWQRDGVNIGAATNNTYVIVTGDLNKTIRCVVTGTNVAGNSSANSNGILIVPAAPVETAATDKTDVSFVNNYSDVGADGYFVYLYASDGTTLISKTNVGNVTNPTTSGRTQNTNYKVAYSSYNAGGESTLSGQISVTTYTQLAQQFFTLRSITDVAQKENYNTFVLDLAPDGVTQPMAFIHMFGKYAGQELYSVFGGITGTVSGVGLTFNQGSGVIFPGNRWINSGWTPSATPSYYSLNNAGVGYKRIGINPPDGQYFLFSTASSSPEDLSLGSLSMVLFRRINSNSTNGNDYGVNPTSVLITRTSSTTINVYYDASSDLNVASNSTAINTTELQIGGQDSTAYAPNGTGLSHIYAGHNDLDKSVIDAAVAAFYSRM